MSGLRRPVQERKRRVLAGMRPILLPIPDIRPVEPGTVGIRQITTHCCRMPPAGIGQRDQAKGAARLQRLSHKG